jgi:hypothetical protein
VPDRAALHWTKSYRYLPAISAYSSGAAAEPGYEIVGLRFRKAPPVRSAFLALDRELEARGLAPTAVVGFELRSPEPVSLGAFSDFNSVYESLLAERGMLGDGVNPVTRTNVAPVRNPPADVVVCGAFLVRPSPAGGASDFVIAGSGEVNGSLSPANIVALGDVSQDGLAEKAEFVLGEMLSRIQAVGAEPGDPNVINVYTAHEIRGLPEMIAKHLPAAARYGYVHWAASPPVTDIEFEMDCRHLSAWELI